MSDTNVQKRATTRPINSRQVGQIFVALEDFIRHASEPPTEVHYQGVRLATLERLMAILDLGYQDADAALMALPVSNAKSLALVADEEESSW